MQPAPTGILLAAGCGTRLSPLTLGCPKALVPLHGIPLVEFALRNLEELGCTCIAVNGHHLSGVLGKWLKDRQKRKPETELRFFPEEKLLGVGGGLKHMSAQLPQGTLLVQNADVLHNFALDELLQEHHDSNATISLVLAGKPHVVTVVEKQITEFLAPSRSNHGFTGIHVLSDELRDRLGTWNASGIIPFYQRLLLDGWALHALTPSEDSLWVDMGHVSEYLGLHQRLWKNEAYQHLLQKLELHGTWSDSEEVQLIERLRDLGYIDEGQIGS